MKVESFEFTRNGQRLCGELCLPDQGVPIVAGMVQTFGHGRTAVKGAKAADDFFKLLTSVGVACVAWDRAGCGDSQGMYDHHQSPRDSGAEAAVAAREFSRRTGLPLSRIGFSGGSRACWINTYAITELGEAAYLIAVSSAGDESNFPYLIRTNLKLEGRTDAEIEGVLRAYAEGEAVLRRGGTYADYLAVVEPFAHDPFVRLLDERGYGVLSALQYRDEQRRGSNFDEEIADFGACLSRLRCPVLAIWGAKDSQVDWRAAMRLYERTVANLRVQVFPDGNHALQRVETGGVREMFAGRNMGHYYRESAELQVTWLQGLGLASK